MPSRRALLRTADIAAVAVLSAFVSVALQATTPEDPPSRAAPRPPCIADPISDTAPVLCGAPR
ncbi:hypothetical protein [Neoroseomonas oryzicola]|uniref:Twin-arginine translocation signal domain-containing protein n=1 Tax=Neoroseomonas oryzicola TaxID=535904 RepID=A0A9X9WFM7_9PROT|nr:hypothetical protein [Neoroseomonas oryzicola]MBR0659137.1 hypothetical protein [Neoroseomonas oryzicola]NKE17709.1 hypothetical protein [Neoroseomonas oryzicola]